MDVEKILPEDFDGTFRFTNWTDEEFIGKWGSREYHFPAGTTSPLVMTNQTPLEIQQIRKKFAKDLAEREFFKSETYKKFLMQERNPDGTPRANGIHMAGSYSLDDLAPFIKKCLIPLEVTRAFVTESPIVNTEDKLSRDEEGDLNTIAVAQKGDLIEERKKVLTSRPKL